MHRCTYDDGCGACTRLIEDVELWLEYGPVVDDYQADTAAERYERALHAAGEA